MEVTKTIGQRFEVWAFRRFKLELIMRVWIGNFGVEVWTSNLGPYSFVLLLVGF